MTCGGRSSRSGPADDADGEGTGLLEHVADAVGELWDDEPDEP